MIAAFARCGMATLLLTTLDIPSSVQAQEKNERNQQQGPNENQNCQQGQQQNGQNGEQGEKQNNQKGNQGEQKNEQNRNQGRYQLGPQTGATGSRGPTAVAERVHGSRPAFLKRLFPNLGSDAILHR